MCNTSLRKKYETLSTIKKNIPEWRAVKSYCIGRRDKDEGNQPNVLCKPCIGFLIALKLLFHPTLHTAIDMFFLTAFIGIATFEDKEILVMGNDLRIDGGKSTATEREIVDRIQKIGFPLAIVADETVHLGRQF